jgi:hypothetical protein
MQTETSKDSEEQEMLTPEEILYDKNIELRILEILLLVIQKKITNIHKFNVFTYGIFANKIECYVDDTENSEIFTKNFRPNDETPLIDILNDVIIYAKKIEDPIEIEEIKRTKNLIEIVEKIKNLEKEIEESKKFSWCNISFKKYKNKKKSQKKSGVQKKKSLKKSSNKKSLSSLKKSLKKSKKVAKSLKKSLKKKL